MSTMAIARTTRLPELEEDEFALAIRHTRGLARLERRLQREGERAAFAHAQLTAVTDLGMHVQSTLFSRAYGRIEASFARNIAAIDKSESPMFKSAMMHVMETMGEEHLQATNDLLYAASEDLYHLTRTHARRVRRFLDEE